MFCYSLPALWIGAYGTNHTWSNFNTFPRFVADVNGDGKADIVGFATNGVYVSLNALTSISENNCNFNNAIIINSTIVCGNNNSVKITINGNTEVPPLKKEDKVDVSGYDCIEKGIQTACQLSSGPVQIATCGLDLVNKATDGSVLKAAHAIIESIPIVNKIDDVLDFFIGGAIKNVCDGNILDASLVAGVALISWYLE